MYNRKCSICNIDFQTKSQKQVNCKAHKGLFTKLYSLINNELHKTCKKCKNTKKVTEFYSKDKGRLNSWCKDCFNGNQYLYQKNKAISRKIDLMKKLGNKCSKCSYNKNLAALAFHHTDPTKKEFSLDARTLGNMSLAEIEKEVSTCIILCHNCHMEEHYPDLDNLL